MLSQDVINSEKHVENIKTALTNSEKKITGALLGGTSDSTSIATPEKKIKKLPGSSLSNCFNEASELLSSSKNDSVLGFVYFPYASALKRTLTLHFYT